MKYLGGVYPNQWYLLKNNKRTCGMVGCRFAGVLRLMFLERPELYTCPSCRIVYCPLHTTYPYITGQICLDCVTEDDGLNSDLYTNLRWLQI
jgi:hypothetical protein